MIFPAANVAEARELVDAREAVYLGAVSSEAAHEVLLERGEDFALEGRPAPEDEVWVRGRTRDGRAYYARYIVR
ncbi:xylose isomerase domain protein TIM barrel (plasmid) [Oceanithermus profundus DSM 14977]|uniref:Xylose isomerase domain protein TIM barrel n=1 Tax=Oceanithermus profundus (strain DSM 14977 / NBRC 100410 / VKM B-2274 / 506) TaxID=670487 RepID=E4UAP4_OCEP5|nr:xylose isomerase domain protein TIM barrel [Oceanithermus profundus DSM 14977]